MKTKILIAILLLILAIGAVSAADKNMTSDDTTSDEYLTNHGNEKIKSKEQMDVIFSEIVTNSESVSGTVKLPIDYEDGEYVISDMSELIDIMYGRLVSHIKELHDKEVEGNKESKGE